jgi:hypothetical protein
MSVGCLISSPVAFIPNNSKLFLFNNQYLHTKDELFFIDKEFLNKNILTNENKSKINDSKKINDRDSV